MMVRQCDRPHCGKNAGFTVRIDHNITDVCMDHVGWPIVVSCQNGRPVSATVQIAFEASAEADIDDVSRARAIDLLQGRLRVCECGILTASGSDCTHKTVRSV